MRILKYLKANKLLIFVLGVYLLLFIFMPEKAVLSLDNSIYYVIEMLKVMPVIFVLTAIMEVWVPKEVIINSFGKKAGIKGYILSFILGSVSAGPIYAAFPVCKMLLKKGASVTNIVVILSSWAVIKIPMLANEAKFLGINFMGVRWVLTVISIILMANIIAVFIKKKNVKMPIEDKSNEELGIKEEYCVGCGLCYKADPENFKMENGKAVYIGDDKNEIDDDMEKLMDRCPANAIILK